MDLSSTGKTIAKLRRATGMTQKIFAEKLGVSDKAVSKWERGISCPDVSLWGKLSHLLDSDIETLIYGHSMGEDWKGVLVLDSRIHAETIVYDKPLINYLISQFLLVGIKDITVVGATKISIPGVSITIEQELNQRFTKNAFIIFGNQFIYGPNLTRHFQRAMYENQLSVIAIIKNKGRYPITMDMNKKCECDNLADRNTYFGLDYRILLL